MLATESQIVSSVAYLRVSLGLSGRRGCTCLSGEEAEQGSAHEAKPLYAVVP